MSLLEPVQLAQARKIAIKYGSVGIQSIESVTGTSKIRFNLVNGMSFDCDLATLSLMWKATYDKNNDGVVDKSETLKNNADNTFHDGEFYLDKANHTGTDEATKVTIDSDGFVKNLKGKNITTAQDIATFIDSFNTVEDEVFYLGTPKVENNWRILKKDRFLKFERYDVGTDDYVEYGSFGGSFETDNLILSNWSGRLYSRKADNSVKSLIRGSVDGNGVVLGNLEGRASLVSDGTNFVVHPKGDIFNMSLPPMSEADAIAGATTVRTLTTATSIPIDIVIYGYEKLYVVSAPVGTKCRIISTLMTGEIIGENCTHSEFINNLGTPVPTSGELTVYCKEPMPINAHTAIKTIIYFTKDVKLQGSILNLGYPQDPQFYARNVLKCQLLSVENLATQEWIKTNLPLSDAIDLDSSTTCASSKAVNKVRKLITTAVSGMTYLGAISCEAFALIDNANIGNFYKLSNDGIIFGKQYKANTSVVIKNQLTDTLITEDDVDFFTVEANSSSGIWVTAVTNYTDGKNVNVVMKNPPNSCVDSISTDDTKIYVTVEWDRNAEEYCGTPVINGQTISTISTKNGGTFTATVLLDISDVATTTINCDNNGQVFSVPITKEVAPVITALTLNQTYPNSQTEVKAGDTMTFNITADKPFTKIQVQGYGCATSTILVVAEGTTANNVQFTVRATGVTPQAKIIRCKVYSPTGSVSEWFESTNTITCNDAVPTLAITGYAYPSTQSALKNTEQCTVAYSIDTGCTVSPSVTADLTLDTHSTVDKTVLVTRLSGNYNDSVNNIILTATKTSNGATTVVGGVVCIAHVAPTLNTIVSPFVIRSGDGIVTNPVGFSQKIKVTTVTSAGTGYGTLISTTTTLYSSSYTFSIMSSDTDTKSNSTVNTTLVITGMAGLTNTVQIPYKLKGFAVKSFTLTSPSLSASLGTAVVDETKLVVTNAKINSTPPFEIMKRKVSFSTLSGELADAWAYDGGKVYVSPAVSSFGYSSTNNISFIIEETV